MAADVVARLEAAHARWLDAQREAAGLVAAAAHPGHPTDWAEGFRWLGRLASIAFDWVVEKNDPLHPALFLQQDAYRKFIVDNPDVNYHFCVLDPRETYRLRGTRGAAPYVGLTFGTDVFRWGEGDGGPTGTLTQCHLDQFHVGPDGAVDVVLSAREHSGDWIPLAPRTQHLAIRETFTDRDTQRPAALRVERVGPPVAPPRLMPDDYAAKLELAASFFGFVVRACLGMWAGSAASVNRLAGAAGADHVEAQEDAVDTHCSTEMVYMGGRWRLEEGEALVVTIRPPARPFTYWGLTLVNPWAESYDYRFARTCTNNARAARTADGSWRVVIAPEDPGAQTWLDTGGRREGQMLLRWVLADRPPAPTCEVVPLGRLRASG